jgi:NAD(P)-dependent dehydrogenase (short-subunit alcohol dehydrogenase family)
MKPALLLGSSRLTGEHIMAIALITGTSSGIGLATAVTLARADHTVIATMRNLDSADELSRLVMAEQLPVKTLALDVDNDASVARAFETALSEHGRIDVLVNNAGINQPGSVEETPLESFRAIMETNYFGVLRCIKAVLPHMIAARSGCIVNISSVAGRIALAPQTAYVASKHALEGLSECLAQEVKAFNVRVALVEPGAIATPIFKKMGSPKTRYPHGRRLAALFAAMSKQPTPPEVVAEQVRQIIEGGSWQLRYPVGPHAPIAFAWRARTSDEEWVAMLAGSDADWAARVKREFGIDLAL